MNCVCKQTPNLLNPHFRVGNFLKCEHHVSKKKRISLSSMFHVQCKKGTRLTYPLLRAVNQVKSPLNSAFLVRKIHFACFLGRFDKKRNHRLSWRMRGNLWKRERFMLLKLFSRRRNCFYQIIISFLNLPSRAKAITEI